MLFRQVFKSKSETRVHCDREMGCQASSTPRRTRNQCTGMDVPVVSRIDRSCSSPSLISTATLAELERSFRSQLTTCLQPPPCPPKNTCRSIIPPCSSSTPKPRKRSPRTDQGPPLGFSFCPSPVQTVRNIPWACSTEPPETCSEQPPCPGSSCPHVAPPPCDSRPCERSPRLDPPRPYTLHPPGIFPAQRPKQSSKRAEKLCTCAPIPSNKYPPRPCVVHPPGISPVQCPRPCKKHFPKPCPFSDPCSPEPSCPSEHPFCSRCGARNPCSRHPPKPEPCQKILVPCSAGILRDESSTCEDECPQLPKSNFIPRKVVQSKPTPCSSTMKSILENFPLLSIKSNCNKLGRPCLDSLKISCDDYNEDPSDSLHIRQSRPRDRCPSRTRSRSVCGGAPLQRCSSSSSCSISPCASTMKMISRRQSTSCPATPRFLSAARPDYCKGPRKSPCETQTDIKIPCSLRPLCGEKKRRSSVCPRSICPESEKPSCYKRARSQSPCTRSGPDPPCKKSPCPRGLCSQSHSKTSPCAGSPRQSYPYPIFVSPESPAQKSYCPRGLCSKSHRASSPCPASPCSESPCSSPCSPRQRIPCPRSVCPELPSKKSPCPRGLCSQSHHKTSPCAVSPRQSYPYPIFSSPESPPQNYLCPRGLYSKSHRITSPCSASPRLISPCTRSPCSSPDPPCQKIPCPRSLCTESRPKKSPCPRGLCFKAHNITSPCSTSPRLISPCTGSPNPYAESFTCDDECPQLPRRMLESKDTPCPSTMKTILEKFPFLSISPCSRSPRCQSPRQSKTGLRSLSPGSMSKPPPCPRYVCSKPHRATSPCRGSPRSRAPCFESPCPGSPRLRSPCGSLQLISCPRPVCPESLFKKSPCPRYLCSKPHQATSPCGSPCSKSPKPPCPWRLSPTGSKTQQQSPQSFTCNLPQQSSPCPRSLCPESPGSQTSCPGSPNSVPCNRSPRKSTCPRGICRETPTCPHQSNCTRSLCPEPLSSPCPGSPGSISPCSTSLQEGSSCPGSPRKSAPCPKSLCPPLRSPRTSFAHTASPCMPILCSENRRSKSPCEMSCRAKCRRISSCPGTPLTSSGGSGTLPRCPAAALRSKDQTSVAATLKDFVNKIASYAAKYTDGINDGCSAASQKEKCRNIDCSVIEPGDEECPASTSQNRSCAKDARRCVQFKKPCDEVPCGLEELYFNLDLNKKAVASTEACEMCSNEECHQPNAPCVKLINECKDAQNHESGAGSSLGTSGSGGVGGCDAARALYYHDKLLATLKVLQNREETVRVQTESLTVAEQRIATLKVRNMQMRRELDQNAQEIRTLRKNSCPSVNTTMKTEVGVCTEPLSQEVDSQKNVVTTLQTNLSVIEDLYRESFYETAKQEALIENLRKSYLDVRLMEKEKAQQIDSLQNVINTQKWSLERCQDVAMEVEELKMEISNFLNNSNNDSGVWEPSLAGELGEDLHYIMQQLHSLRDLLQVDCECGLKSENEKLKEKNAELQHQVEEYQQRMCSLECGLNEKEETISRFKMKIDETNEQIHTIMCELQALQRRENERQHECDCLHAKLRETEEMLAVKTMELSETQQENKTLECTARSLREELDKADQIIKDNCRVRSEVSYLSQQVSLWRRQLAESEARVRGVEAELARARNHCRNIDTCYREKATAALALQGQLEEAHARGAELCAEARRVVCAVRHWVRRMRATNSEQEEKLKEQEAVIDTLRKAIEEAAQCRREYRPECSPFAPNAFAGVGCSQCAAKHATNTVAGDDPPVRASERSECRCKRDTVCRRSAAGASERASTASATSPSRRLRRMFCEGAGIMHCTVHERREPQRIRAEASGTAQQPYVNDEEPTRTVSPTEELFEQVNRLQEAMTEGQRIWSKPKRNPRR